MWTFLRTLKAARPRGHEGDVRTEMGEVEVIDEGTDFDVIAAT